MFGKVFATLWNGSMVGKPDVQLVFCFLLAHANKHGEVDVFPTVISVLTGLPMDRVGAALQELLDPDPQSRSLEEDGRRIVMLDGERSWGWRIVNYAKYRAMRDEESRRDQNRQSADARRERLRAAGASTAEVWGNVSKRQQRQQTSAHAEAEAEEEKIEPSPQEPAAAASLAGSVDDEVANLISIVTGSARMPHNGRPSETATSTRPQSPDAAAPKAGANPSVLASVQNLARPLGTGGVRDACRIVNYLHKRGVTHGGLLLAVAGHWIAHHDRIHEPFAYYNPGGAGWDALRMVLSARGAEDEHAAMLEVDRQWAKRIAAGAA